MEILRQPAAPGKRVGGCQAKKHAHKREAFGPPGPIGLFRNVGGTRMRAVLATFWR
jgi:hypothetical protein